MQRMTRLVLLVSIRATENPASIRNLNFLFHVDQTQSIFVTTARAMVSLGDATCE